jgi:flagellar basal body-associated protein FliL
MKTEEKTMKLHKNKHSMIAGIVAVCVLLIAVMVIVNVTSNQGELPIEGVQNTGDTVTAPGSVTQGSVNQSNVTNQPQAAQTRQTGNSNTEPVVIEVTLALVEVPNERVREIIEQNDVQIAPPARTQTSPPPSEQRSPTATTVIDGQKHVWDPIFGWIPDYGEGTVIIMDVEDDGRRYEGGW